MSWNVRWKNLCPSIFRTNGCSGKDRQEYGVQVVVREVRSTRKRGLAPQLGDLGEREPCQEWRLSSWSMSLHCDSET